MISADVKSWLKQQELKELEAVSVTFNKNYLQNLKCNLKQACVLFI